MPDGIITAIEAGEARFRAVTARYRDGAVRLLAHGEAKGEGVQGGHVTDAAAASRAVRAALRTVERQLGYPLYNYNAVLCVSGAVTHTLSGQAAVEPSGLRRSVTEKDTNRVLARARPRLVDARQRALHVLPMRYTVDGVVYDDPPLRARGRELTVSTCALTAETAVLQGLANAVEGAGLHVTDMVASPLASGLAALSEAEQRVGILLLEIGAHSTTVALFQRGCFLYADNIPLGGYHLTNDLAVGLSLPFEAAERLKTEQGALYLDGGAATLTLSSEQGTVVNVQRQEMVSLLRDRAEEILALAARRIQSAGWEHLPVGGIVLTGASARLNGMERLARDLLRAPARVAKPRGMEAMPPSLQDPAWTTTVGALLWKALCLSGERSSLATVPATGVSPLSQRLGSWASRIFENEASPSGGSQQAAGSSVAVRGAESNAAARKG